MLAPLAHPQARKFFPQSTAKNPLHVLYPLGWRRVRLCSSQHVNVARRHRSSNAHHFPGAAKRPDKIAGTISRLIATISGKVCVIDTCYCTSRARYAN